MILINANRAWLLLLIATAVTWGLGDRGAGGRAVAIILGLAWIKGLLVIYEFMELRHAPRLWKRLLIGWLSVVVALIALAYWMGID